ncbi:AAA family ATPase [Actinoallomurus sp. NPDC052308]|uniref:ATP-binding protein n=1 Tax=Actinoallomurus sp. NPDC052308 TaxID=3155530 RepID=UPI003415A104
MAAIVTELGEHPEPWLERRTAIESRQNASAQEAPSQARGPSRPASDLLGRATDIERVEAVVEAAAAGRSGVLVLRGEAGVGKSALLAAATGGSEIPSLSMRCVQSEAELAFSALSGLLRPLTHLIPRLPGPQRRALEVSLALSAPEPGESAPSAVAIGLGVLSLLADSAPAVVVLDDVQWMDQASALALSFAIRRLGGEGVGVLVAVRSEGSCPMDLTDHPAAELTGLDRSAAEELANRVRDRPVSHGELDWLMRHTGGNPLAVSELCRPGRPLGGAADDGPPPALPEVLTESFRRRLESLPTATRRALLVCAAGYSTDLAQLAEALGDGGLDHLEPAETTGLLVVADNHVEFAHPLIRAAVYHAAAPAQRRGAHAHLARTRNGPGVSAADQRAWHWAEATLGTNEEVASGLADTAERARQRGALAAACSAYRRAAGLTPQPETRARRLLAAATSAYLLGRPDDAIPLLDQVCDLTTEPGVLGEVDYIRNQIRQLRMAPGEVFAELTAAAAGVRDRTPEAAVAMYATAASAAIMGGLIPQSIDAATAGHALACAAIGSDTLASMVLWMTVLIVSGRSAEAAMVFRRDGHRLFAADPLAHGTEVFGYAALCLMWLNEHAAAYRFIETAMRRLTAANAMERVACLTSVLAELEFRRGRWNAAYATASRCVALADVQGQIAFSGYASYTLGRIEAAQGQSRRCREYGEGARSRLELAEYAGLSLYAGVPLAELALSQGDDDAAELFLRLDGRREAQGFRNAAMFLHHAELVEACLNANRRHEAWEALRRLTDEAGSSLQDSVHAALERCRGLLATDPDLAHEHLTAAIELYDRCTDPYALARTRLSCAQALMRAGRQPNLARDHLEEARRLFRQLHAVPWLQQTERALGLRPRRSTKDAYAKLTAQEVQVARLAAQGATITETAEALFLSTQTVETLLATACSRLRTRSHAELAGLLADTDRA